jgi:hypothetical protein
MPLPYCYQVFGGRKFNTGFRQVSLTQIKNIGIILSCIATSNRPVLHEQLSSSQRPHWKGYLMRNGLFWYVTPCDSCKNRRFGGLSASIIRVTRIGELGTTLVHRFLSQSIKSQKTPFFIVTVVKTSNLAGLPGSDGCFLSIVWLYIKW